jgi:hypothetical protein
MCIRQGPGFPLTRKGNRGFSETLLVYVVLGLFLSWLSLDSVEFWRWLEFLKGLDVPITFS